MLFFEHLVVVKNLSLCTSGLMLHEILYVVCFSALSSLLNKTEPELVFDSSLNYTIKQLLFAQEPSFRKYEIAQKSLIRVPFVAFAVVGKVFNTHFHTITTKRELDGPLPKF